VRLYQHSSFNKYGYRIYTVENFTKKLIHYYDNTINYHNNRMSAKYEEFIGKEPSLNELERFIRINKETIEEYNSECIKENAKENVIDYSVINTYLTFAKEYGGHYYIGGYIKTYPNDPITEAAILKARKQNNESEPTLMGEFSSQLRSSKELYNLEKILEIYYEKCLEEYYAPPCQNSNLKGGEGYEKLAKETLVGKK